jgi:hypothetical protein
VLVIKKFLQKLNLHQFRYVRSSNYKFANNPSPRTMHLFQCQKCKEYYHKHTSVNDIVTYVPFIAKFGCRGKNVNH